MKRFLSIMLIVAIFTTFVTISGISAENSNNSDRTSELLPTTTITGHITTNRYLDTTNGFWKDVSDAGIDVTPYNNQIKTVVKLIDYEVNYGDDAAIGIVDYQTGNFSIDGTGLVGSYCVQIEQVGFATRWKMIELTGSNKDIGDKYLWPGDIDGDMYISFGDIATFLPLYGTSIEDVLNGGTYNPAADFNTDGYINAGDFFTLLRYYGESVETYDDPGGYPGEL